MMWPMSTILISGHDASHLAALLQQNEHDVVTAPTVAALRDVVQQLDPGSISVYIQLPVRVTTEGANAVEVIGHFLREGLLRRFDAASAALPSLATGAGLLLVAGNHPQDSQAPDNPEARIALMKVLGHALLLERPDGVSVSIVGSDTALERVAEIADQMLSAPETVKPFALWLERTDELSDEIPAWDYADWRNALLTMDETLA